MTLRSVNGNDEIIIEYPATTQFCKDERRFAGLLFMWRRLPQAPRRAGPIGGAARSPLQRAHRLPDTPALPKKHRDDVAGGARETRHPVREEHPPGRTGGKQNDTGLSTNK